jgi:hypothetical protein
MLIQERLACDQPQTAGLHDCDRFDDDHHRTAFEGKSVQYANARIDEPMRVSELCALLAREQIT